LSQFASAESAGSTWLGSTAPIENKSSKIPQKLTADSPSIFVNAIQASLMQPSFSSDANSSTCIALCLQADVIPTCRELGIGIVAYSPLGRGFLTGTVRSIKDLHEKDWRVVRMPRFQGENLEVRMLLLIAVFSIDCHHHHHSGESRPQWYPFDPVMCCC